MSYKGPVITIGREYGAGGSTIAAGLSKELGIPWYDHDFVKLIAKKSGYSEEEIMEEGEEISSQNRFWDKLLGNSMAYTSSYDEIYKAQKEAILELAKGAEPCIIVGRCSNDILKTAGIKSFDVFLYADKEIRIERAKELVPDSVKDIKKYVEKRDALRDNYYKAYAGESMNTALDYSICLDTGCISYETCIRIIADIVKTL